MLILITVLVLAKLQQYPFPLLALNCFCAACYAVFAEVEVLFRVLSSA